MSELVMYFMFVSVVFAAAGYFLGSGKISFKPGTIVALLCLLLLPMILNFFIWAYSAVVPEVYVPKVLGMTSEEAGAILEKSGLSGEISGMSFSKEPGGTVISQQPEAGRKVKIGREIRLVVSASERSVILPNLVGKTSEEAAQIISSVGLVIGKMYGLVTDTAYGLILEQSPSPGSTLTPGSDVSITISMGKTEQ